MLSWMCGKFRKDKISDEKVREYLVITPIEDKIKDTQLTWYGYVMLRFPTTPITRCLDMQITQGVGGVDSRKL